MISTHVLDLRPGPASSSALGFVRVGDHLLFSARDDEHGREPWVVDLVAPVGALLRARSDDSSSAGVAALVPLDPVDDLYIADFTAWSDDPDGEVLGNRDPLVVYEVSTAETLYLTTTPEGRILVGF